MSAAEISGLVATGVLLLTNIVTVVWFAATQSARLKAVEIRVARLEEEREKIMPEIRDRLVRLEERLVTLFKRVERAVGGDD